MNFVEKEGVHSSEKKRTSTQIGIFMNDKKKKKKVLKEKR